MPIYMDRHDLESVTAKDVAEAHREDLKIQEKYQCKGLTYWFDEERGTAFCLIEAPNENCVKEMHDNAHGLVPHQIIEVENKVVNAFLGRIEDPQSSEFLEDSDLPIINEPAFRTIMYLCLMDVALFKSTLGNEEASNIINRYHQIIRSTVKMSEGREVKQTSFGYIISFTSVSKAVLCAVEIQKQIKSSNNTIQVRIGLSAGSPVTGQNELFSETVQLAKRLCEVANQDNIVVSSAVKEVYNKEELNGFKKDVSIQALSPNDEEFLTRLMDITESIWNDPEFDLERFGKQIGLSRSQLYRKTSSLTGLSPNVFIREFRLKKALKLISKQTGNVTEIAYETGFNSPSYFSKCFQKRFGILPSFLASKIS